MNITFFILCLDNNTNGLRNTVASLQLHNPKEKIRCLIGNNVHDDNKKQLSKIVTVNIGGNTVTSLLDKGLELAEEWCFFLIAGSWVKRYTFSKYLRFANNKKDILFPIIQKRWLFPDGSLNGVLVHKDVLNDVGPFASKEADLTKAKLLWANKAICEGYHFKGIVGVNFL